MTTTTDVVHRPTLVHSMGGLYVPLTDDMTTDLDTLVHELGMDYTVWTEPLYHSLGPDAGVIPLPNHQVILRDHRDGHISGIAPAGVQYTPLQNREILDMGQAIVHESGGTARWGGGLVGKGGAVCMAFLRVGDGILIGRMSDLITAWLILIWRHDARGTAMVTVNPERPECGNQMPVFVGGQHGQPSFKIYHRTGATTKVQEAREALDVTMRYLDTWTAEAERLAEHTISPRQAREFFNRVFPAPEDKEAVRAVKLHEDRMEAVTRIYDSKTCADIKGTAWGVFNAIGEYVDHEMPTKAGAWAADGITPKDARVLNTLTGGAAQAGNQIRQRAYAMAQRLG